MASEVCPRSLTLNFPLSPSVCSPACAPLSRQFEASGFRLIVFDLTASPRPLGSRARIFLTTAPAQGRWGLPRPQAGPSRAHRPARGSGAPSPTRGRPPAGGRPVWVFVPLFVLRDPSPPNVPGRDDPTSGGGRKDLPPGARSRLSAGSGRHQPAFLSPLGTPRGCYGPEWLP